MKHLHILMAAMLSLSPFVCLAQTDSTAVNDTIHRNMNLDDVVVTAQRVLVKTESDRISYDVTHDDDAKTNPLNEILRKVPFVTVEADGTIKVKGSSNFKIYKNGRPNQTFSSNAKELFKSLSANSVKRIEVITDPGAKYDAEGLVGILNIVMDTSSNMRGITGTVSLQSGYGVNQNPYSASIFLTAQTGKLTFAPYYGHAENQREWYENTSDLQYNNGANYQSHQRHRNPGAINYYGMEMSLEIDSLNLINASGSGFNYGINLEGSNKVKLYNAEGTIYSYGSNERGQRYGYNDLDFELSYQHLTHMKGESLSFNYLFATTRSHNYGYTDYVDCINFSDYDNQYADNHTRYNEHTFQLDYERPFGKHHSLDVGAKYNLSINESNNELLSSFDNYPIISTRTEFRHTTGIGAAYAEYKYSFDKLTVTSGLRYEFARIRAEYPDGTLQGFHKNMGNLAPSLRLSYRINDANSLKFNYNLRLSRPGISYLNPHHTETPTSISYGNPDLNTNKVHNLSFGYTLMQPKLTLSLNLSSTYSGDCIASLHYIDGNRMVSTYNNNGKVYSLSFSPYVQWKITPTTTLTNNTGIYWAYKDNPGISLSAQHLGYSTYFRLAQDLPCKLKASVTAWLNDRSDFTIYNYDGLMANYSFSLQRSFGCDDRWTTMLRTYWQGNSTTYHTQGDYTGKEEFSIRHFGVGITVSYRFGKLKTSVKKTNKSVDNSDLMGRK